MTKKEFNELVLKIGFDAAYKQATEGLKNVHLAFHGGKSKLKPLSKKQSKKSRQATKRNKQSIKAKLHNYRLSEFANNLNDKLPRSEVWFMNLYKDHFICRGDLFNSPFQSRYIPDILNKEFKYVIEVDGSIHDTEYQKQKDLKKDKFYLNHGYLVIRVKAYCIHSYIECIKTLFYRRNKRSFPTTNFNEFLKNNNLDIKTLGFY